MFLPHGSHVLVRGASGAGKSTLLHLMAGLMLPSEGSVRLGGFDLTALNDSERSRIRRQSVGLIFQKLNLLTHLTVSENVELAINPQTFLEKKSVHQADDRLSRAQAVSMALATVKISEIANVRTSLISGGEQQRVAVARVLAQAPAIILADEPTSSLDDENASFVIAALKAAAIGKTLVVVSHDDRLVRAFEDVRVFEQLSDVDFGAPLNGVSLSDSASQKISKSSRRGQRK